MKHYIFKKSLVPTYFYCMDKEYNGNQCQGSVTSVWYHSWICNRATTLPSCCVLCECAASRVLEPCALLSACLVSCWSVVFWSWHSCLEFMFREWVRTLVLHVLSCYVSVWSRVRSAVHSSVHVFCVAHSLCFSLAVCFYVVVSYVNTWLMSILISCVFVSCFSHGLWFCFSGHVLVFLFCVSTWLLS